MCENIRTVGLANAIRTAIRSGSTIDLGGLIPIAGLRGIELTMGGLVFALDVN